MPLAVAVTAPTTDGRSAYDAKALKFKHRLFTCSGTYAAGGDTITAAECGLRRIVGVLLLSGAVAPASTPTTADAPGFLVSADGQTLTVRLYESGASGAPLGEKGAEAVITGQAFDVLVLGY